jgi:hypothetical protein
MSGIIFVCWVLKMSASMADTGEIDAIAWLLITTPPQYPATFFKKVGQITGFDSIGRYYRPRLLESLMPFLTLLITSHHVPEHLISDTHSPSSSLSFAEDPDLKNMLHVWRDCRNLRMMKGVFGAFGRMRWSTRSLSNRLLINSWCLPILDIAFKLV